MSYGVYRRPFRVWRRLHAVATLTVAAPAVTASLPLARRRIPDSVYRRPAVIIRRRRSIAGLPNADPVVSLPLARRRPPYSVYLRPPPPIVRLRRMVIGLPNADAVVAPPPVAGTKGRRPIRLEIAASQVDLLKLPRPPIELIPSIVVPPIAEMHFGAVVPLVVAGPVELMLKLASINILLARPTVEPGSVTLALPVVPLTRPISYLLNAWSRMDRREIVAIVQEVVEDAALLGFTDKEP